MTITSAEKRLYRAALKQRLDMELRLSESGSYVDRFFARLYLTGTHMESMDHRDVAAEFFEFLRFEGALK